MLKKRQLTRILASILAAVVLAGGTWIPRTAVNAFAAESVAESAAESASDSVADPAVEPDMEFSLDPDTDAYDLEIDMDEDTEADGDVGEWDSEDSDPAEILEAEPETETFIPAEDGFEDDNDEAFAAYVEREMELGSDLRTGTDENIVTSPRLRSNYASRRLNDINRTIYALLLGPVREVAAGSRSDTVFSVTVADLGLEGRAWTAEELGVDAIVADGKITEESKSAINSAVGISGRDVVKSLLADCPYDLYWYDKTIGTRLSGFSFSARRSDGAYVLGLSGEYTLKFSVSADYSLTGKEGTYETNASIGTSVRTAHDNALSIVEKYAGETDYGKLDGYRQEILDLVSYNRTAANDKTMSYGDPWQLIWAFDGDAATNVVCEGYAKSFQYLCDLSSFSDIFKECISVTGTMGTGSGNGHMWNLVQLRDGSCYLADLTNCDSGMAGAGNGGRNLFLVGTGDPDGSEVCAQGDPDSGYTFTKLNGLCYSYDDDTRNRFDDAILTLAAGRVDASTMADGEYTGTHDHIYLPVGEVSATCESDGHSAGCQCAICGEYDASVVVYPGGHTPGEWTVTMAPTCEEEGEETTVCEVCGQPLTRAVDRLIDLAAEAAAGNASAEITSPASALVYTGSALTPEVTVSCGGSTLEEDTDYTVTYDENILAGTDTASATIQGQGLYGGKIVCAFSIAKAPQSAMTAKSAASPVAVGRSTAISVSGAKGTKTFTSSNTAVVSVSSAGKVTAKKVGTAKITVRSAETANYRAASKTVTIRVVPAATAKLKAVNQASSIRLTWARVTGASGYLIYRGSTKIATIKKAATLTCTDSKAVSNGTRYTYRVVATASTGNSTLSKSVSICRVSRPTIKTLKNTASRKITASWSKNAKATGYQLQYSLYSGFTKHRTLTISKASGVSKVIAGLAKNRTYYVRVRTLKKTGGTTYYSAWSAPKKVKITR